MVKIICKTFAEYNSAIKEEERIFGYDYAGCWWDDPIPQEQLEENEVIGTSFSGEDYTGNSLYEDVVLVASTSVEACRGRHNTPAKEAIFENEIDPQYLNGVAWLEHQAAKRLEELKVEPHTILRLYVTGLTVAVIAIINACKRREVDVVLMHYNRAKDQYFAQKVE